MTLIDEAVRAILINNSTVYGLVGTRVFPIKLPLDCTFPAISYLFPSDPYTLAVRAARCQIDCWAEDITECKNLKLAVESALKFYDGTYGDIMIEGIFPIDTSDQPEDVSNIFHITYDFKVIYHQ